MKHCTTLSGKIFPQKRSVTSVQNVKEETVVQIRGTVPNQNVIAHLVILPGSTKLNDACNKGLLLATPDYEVTPVKT